MARGPACCGSRAFPGSAAVAARLQCALRCRLSSAPAAPNPPPAGAARNAAGGGAAAGVQPGGAAPAGAGEAGWAGACCLPAACALPACRLPGPAWAAPKRHGTLLLLRLAQVTGDALEGQSYRCNLAEDVAARLADNVRLRLTDYLRLG